MANRLLAKQAIARQGVSCYNWKPSSFLINEMKAGLCHQRYQERIKKCSEVSIHQAEEEYDESNDEKKPLQVFLL